MKESKSIGTIFEVHIADNDEFNDKNHIYKFIIKIMLNPRICLVLHYVRPIIIFTKTTKYNILNLDFLTFFLTYKMDFYLFSV